MPDVVDIGFTWLAGSAQRTPVNTEAKLLMMTHAFEVWEVHRVALQTDVRNKRSWAAIERIGGQLDGIMRADRPGADDTVRTSARFSIVAEEWPEREGAALGALEAGAERAPSGSDGARRRSGPGERGRDLAPVERVHRGFGLVLGPDRGHGLAGPVDLPGQLIGPLDRVAEDLHERLDDGLERGDVVVPDDDGPQVLDLEECVDVRVGDDRVASMVAGVERVMEERCGPIEPGTV